MKKYLVIMLIYKLISLQQDHKQIILSFSGRRIFFGVLLYVMPIKPIKLVPHQIKNLCHVKIRIKEKYGPSRVDLWSMAFHGPVAVLRQLSDAPPTAILLS